MKLVPALLAQIRGAEAELGLDRVAKPVKVSDLFAQGGTIEAEVIG